MLKVITEKRINYILVKRNNVTTKKENKFAITIFYWSRFYTKQKIYIEIAIKRVWNIIYSLEILKIYKNSM